MYLPLKNPQKIQTTHAFFAACVVILFALAFCVGAFLFYGSLWGIGHAIIGMLAAALPFLLRSTGGILLAGIILGVIMISPFYFRFCVKPILTYFKDRRTLKRFGVLK